jgi:hypothetical protein
MASVSIEIVRSTDNYPPGIVECRLTDASGRVWLFQEKAPVVSADDLGPDDEYPRPGSVDCVVLHRDGAVVRIGVDPCSEYFECDVPAAIVEE